MIVLSHWPSGLRIAILLVPFVSVFIGIVLITYMASSRQFDVMCAALHRSQCLREELKKGGGYTLKFRSMTVSAMTGELLWPTLSIRRGSLNAEDYREFPVYLKRRMRVAAFYIFTALSESALIVAFVDFTRP